MAFNLARIMCTRGPLWGLAVISVLFGEGNRIGAHTGEQQQSGRSPKLSATCNFEIVMVDDRPWKRIGFKKPAYWVVGAMLNYDYAARFNYTFRLVHLMNQRANEGPLYVGWNKVLYLHEHLLEIERDPTSSPCHWILYLDADAYVRMSELALPTFIESLMDRYGTPEDVGLIIGREQNLTGVDFLPRWDFVNTGVLLIRAGPAARFVFASWLEAGIHAGHRRLWTRWPGEQGILTELVSPGSYPDAKTIDWKNRPSDDSLRRAVAVVNMTEMNSPWGRFVQHIWGGCHMPEEPRWAQTELWCNRDRIFEKALLLIDARDVGRFVQLRSEVMRHTMEWSPPGMARTVRLSD